MLFGIDEVGRGAWAGPLIFATVGLDPDVEYDFLPFLKDSKELTKSKLTELNELITRYCYYDVAVIAPGYIDQNGLTSASVHACTDLAYKIQDNFNKPSITIDGNINYLRETSYAGISECVVKADSTIKEVMSASIVAKVYRDNIMLDYSEDYPGFNFENNVGYGTADHVKALNIYCPTPIHRLSYKPLKNINEG